MNTFGLAGAEFALPRSPHGHDAFLIEDRQAALVEPIPGRNERVLQRFLWNQPSRF